MNLYRSIFVQKTMNDELHLDFHQGLYLQPALTKRSLDPRDVRVCESPWPDSTLTSPCSAEGPLQDPRDLPPPEDLSFSI